MGRGAEQIKWPIHLEVNLYPRAFCLCFLLFGHGNIPALLFTLNFSLFCLKLWQLLLAGWCTYLPGGLRVPHHFYQMLNLETKKEKRKQKKDVIYIYSSTYILVSYYFNPRVCVQVVSLYFQWVVKVIIF